MVHGLDLSHWDGTVVWPELPDDYKFCFIKATEGGYKPDPLAWQHWIGAGQEGLLRAPYHFWRADVNAQAQAAEFVARIRWLEAEGGRSELPPVVDLEDPRAPKSSSILPHMRAVLTAVELGYGRRPIIYTAKWWTDAWLGDVSWMREWPLWVADYTAAPPAEPRRLPRGLSDWTFWQYMDWAEIPGIAENDEDADVFSGSLDELYAFAGQTPPMSIDEKVGRLWNAHPELHDV
jgi:lysozyme